MADAVAQQQRHFGRELHDSVAQELTGISMMAATLKQELLEVASPLAARAQWLVDHLHSAHEQVHRLSHGMMPVDVDADGLMVGLEELVEYCNQTHAAECVYQCDDQIAVQDNDTATHLYRIAQESIQNAIKHAQPKHIVVSLRHDGPDVVLTVQDDGCGMKLPPPRSRGAGLRIMQYRANLIRARLTIDASPGHGVMVCCRVRANEPA